MSELPKDSQFHHHVPRFYLKGWSTTAGMKPGRVWIYQKSRPVRHAPIKESGGRENMYAVLKSDGSIDLETVERYIARIESRAGKVFPKILRHENLSAGDREAMAMFLSVMFRRSTYTFDTFAPEKLAPKIPDLHQEMRLQDVSIEDHEKRSMHLVAVERAIELASTNIPSVTALAILSSAPMADFFCRLNWAFFYSHSANFVTSDAPFVFNRFQGIRDSHHGHILFPISRNIILYMNQWMFAPGTYTAISDSLVERLNVRIIWNAHREVYADRNDGNIQAMVDQYIGNGLPTDKGAATS